MFEYSDYWKGKRALVTGGAGMIGHQLVGELLKAGTQVTVLDNFSRGRRINLRPYAGQIGVRDADAGDLATLPLYQGMDVVFNLAARVTGMHYNRRHHSEMFWENIRLQCVPALLAAAAKVPVYHQSSTVCVYPRDMIYPAPESEGHRGDPEPTNEGYGWAKRIGEHAARWLSREHEGKVRVAITRYANCYGPSDYFDWETAHVIPALIRKCMEQDKVMVFGSGRQLREFLYSLDAARGTMLLVERDTAGEPVNIGPGVAISIKDLLGAIQAVLGTNKPAIYDTDIPEGYPRRCSDITRLQEIAGWTPTTSLEDGLRRTIDWYMQHG